MNERNSFSDQPPTDPATMPLFSFFNNYDYLSIADAGTAAVV